MASNGSVGQIVEMVGHFDEASTQAVLVLLIEHARGAIGVESQGVARTLLALAGLTNVSLNQHGGAIANSIAPTLELHPEVLAGAGLPGAWRLGGVTNSTAGRRLQKLVLDAAATRTDPAVGLMVLRDATVALAADVAATQLILQSHLVAAHVADTAAVIEGLEPGIAAGLLRADPASLAAALAAALAPPSAAPAAPATSVAVAAAAATAAASTADDDDDDDDDEDEVDASIDRGGADSAQIHAALVSLLSNLASGQGGPAQALAGVLLLIDLQDMRDIIEASLPSVGAIEEPELTSRILTACRRRVVSLWPSWMGPLSPEILADARFDSELEATTRLLWTRANESDKRPTDAALASAGAALLRLMEGRPRDRWPSLDAVVEAALGDFASDDESALRRMGVLANASPLVEAGLVPVRTLAKAEYGAAVETLAIDDEVDLSESELVSYVVETTTRAVADWDPSLPTGGAIETDELEALAVAADGCGWLPEPQKSVVKLTLRAAWAPADETAFAALPLTDEVVQLWAEFTTAAAPAVQAWLALSPLSAVDLVAIGTAFTRSEPPASVLAALSSTTVGLSRATKLDALRQLLLDAAAVVPSGSVLGALGSQSVSAADLAQVLIERYTACGNNHQRKQVLELWARLDLSSAAKRDLIEQIMIPMFALNQQAKEHALDYVDRLCIPFPPKVKKRLGDAIVAATRGTSIEKRSQDKMKAMGYSVRKAGGFLGLGKTTHVDTGSDQD